MAPEYTWRLTIKTAELAQEAEVPAPSKAERVIVLYGDNGKSDVIPISSDDDHLCEPGYTNNFKVRFNVEDLWIKKKMSTEDVGNLFHMSEI